MQSFTFQLHITVQFSPLELHFTLPLPPPLNTKSVKNLEPGARFSKLPVITGPVKLFCFH